jgi:hypothetical protein
MKGRTIHATELIRLEDARASGLTSDFPALGAPPRRGCQQSFLARRLARRNRVYG